MTPSDTDFARSHGAENIPIHNAEQAPISVPKAGKTLENQVRVGVRQHPRHADLNTYGTGAKSMAKLPATDGPVNTASTDDLLHLVEVMVGKAEREPETADLAISHVKRAFDKIVERMA